MVYKTCSVKKVIAQFYRDFKPSNSGFVDDAIEWIADAIDIMKCAQGYCETNREVEVLDYRVKIPCDLDSLFGISYKGMRLTRNGGLPIRRKWNSGLQHCTDSYSLNPNYISTSFKEGCITIHYWGLPVDCDGYPLVIDTAKYRDALVWYILMKMLARGFKHQVFDYKTARQMWIESYPKAQNECKMPDLDQMETWKHNFLGLVKNINRADNFYRTNGASYHSDVFPPGSMLQTFQVLGERKEDNA